MSKYKDKVRAEFRDGSWAFIDPDFPEGRVKFEQALIDATRIEPGVVDGYVKAVFGVDMSVVQNLCDMAKSTIGVTNNHRLGLECHRRVRLLSDGSVEPTEGGQ